VAVLATLAADGSEAVFWSELKPLVKRLIASRPVLIQLGLRFALSYFSYAPKNLRIYISDIYLGGIKNEDCRKAANLWFDEMSQPSLNSTWALRMFDASGKPPANLLAANTNWLGNWNSCHKVKYEGDKNNETFQFKGRYCRAKIRAEPTLLNAAGDALDGFPGNPDDLAAIDLGLCVPNFCDGEDVGSVVTNALRLLTVHQLSGIRKVEDIQCEGPPTLSATYYFSLVLITILTVIVILATLYDCFFRTILNKPFATASTLSMQNLHTSCNFSSSREQPHGIFYQNLNAYYYQFSNRLRLHAMSYPSEAERTAVIKSRKQWYNQFVYKIHKIAIELSAYTAILKPMSSTGKQIL
jgi:hypothetical protein